jgi:hypothetical protein
VTWGDRIPAFANRRNKPFGPLPSIDPEAAGLETTVSTRRLAVHTGATVYYLRTTRRRCETNPTP